MAAGDTVSWQMINSNNIDRKKVLQMSTLTTVRAMRSILCAVF
jgi:hypothetical protein